MLATLHPEATPMKNDPSQPGAEIGLIGLGAMGRNFLLNIAGHNFRVAGYDQDPARVAALSQATGRRDIHGATDLTGFIASLRRPRTVILMVPAGAPVDAVIDDLLAHLEAGDLIVDAGNSHFKDTDARANRLEAKGIQFLGVGISGGEEGARRGPSIMPGGPIEAYERVRPIFEVVAAQVNGEPCVAYLGPGSAGHFTKMVHNGIEYALMQLMAETYDLMKRGVGLNHDELCEYYVGWNKGGMKGYLLEITGHILSQKDGKTGQRLLDQIRGVANEMGAGIWDSQCALELRVPIPTIDAAVAMRHLAALENERATASAVLPRPPQPFPGDRGVFLRQLGRALFAGTIIAFAQGLALLRAASEKYAYGLDLSTVARIWRGGCTIRAAVLEDIREAYRHEPRLCNLLLDPELAKTMLAHQDDLRAVVAVAAQLGLPAPGFMTALSYFDGYRSSWLPANLIQAQHDYFGAHAYERIDAPGTSHTERVKEPDP
jgi:6-phosphogluconate dehydrogenase